MNLNTISFKRRNILGELYKKCDTVSSIPVYMNDKTEEPIGTVGDCADSYADAFLFHLPDHVCKKLSTNSYNIGIDYDLSEESKDLTNARIKLNCIILAVKQGSEPIPRRNGISVPVQN